MIEDLQIRKGAIPLSETMPRQLWISEWSNQLFVRLTASTITGWGEVLPAAGNMREPYVALIHRFSEGLMGENEAEIEKLWTTMCRMSFTGGYGITTGAISGIDIALWDIRARKAGCSLFETISKKSMSTPKLSRYASLSRYGKNSELLDVVGELIETGYKSIKIHQSVDDTLEAVKLLRQSYGKEFALMVDLNCGFSYQAAERFIRTIEPYELKWIEEPVWPSDDFESLRRLNRLGPVAAGENFFSIHEFKRLLEKDTLTFYQPDVTKCGGITALIKIVETLVSHGSKIALHNRPDNGWIGLMAGAHVVSSIDPSAIVESPPNEIPAKYFEFTGKLDIDSIQVGGPGLGISPIEPIPESLDSKLLRFH